MTSTVLAGPAQRPALVPTLDRRLRRGLTAAASGLAAAVPWGAAQLAGVDLSVAMAPGESPTEIGLPVTLNIAVVVALAGWAALALLERFVRRSSWAVWSWLAGAVLLVSFVPVATVEATTGARTVLAAMHLVVAAVLFVGLRPARSAR